MRKHYSYSSGFTIVEVLVVIVVIAILAAVSTVAYANIQNRTHDSVIKNDLVNLSKKIQLATADTGSYPAGGREQLTEDGAPTGSHVASLQPPIDIVATTVSYDEPTSSGSVNLTYCTGVGDSSGKQEYILTAKSKSGNRFQYSSMRGLESRGVGNIVYPGIVCTDIGYPHSYSYGYSYNQSGWQSWVK